MFNQLFSMRNVLRLGLGVAVWCMAAASTAQHIDSPLHSGVMLLNVNEILTTHVTAAAIAEAVSDRQQ